MSPKRTIALRGASLIEVMLAVALTAITALGLIAAQLWAAREARAVAVREQAAFVADAIVEVSRAPGGGFGLQQWKARAASLLPQGGASVSEQGGGISLVSVMWSAVNNPASAEFIDRPGSCGDVALAAGMTCIAMAFVQ